jgi:hypothetical protein
MCENPNEHKTITVIRIGPWLAEPRPGELGEWGVYAPLGVEQERFCAEPGVEPGQMAWLVCGPG